MTKKESKASSIAAAKKSKPVKKVLKPNAKKTVKTAKQSESIFEFEVKGLIPADSTHDDINNCVPSEIVKQLDRHIVGQSAGKKAVAIAFRNRWRRMRLPSPLRDEIIPKNILMTGPTGVGKTEIARRLAKLAGAPFLKVEATKYTEVGYVGRDVEAIIRDLTDRAIVIIREKIRVKVLKDAKPIAREKIIAAILSEDEELSKEDVSKKFDSGELDECEIEIELKEQAKSQQLPMFDMPGVPGGGQIGVMNIGEMLGKLFVNAKNRKKRKLLVSEAFESLVNEEVEKMIDEDWVIKEALEAVSQNGMVFIDEFDKIVSRDGVRGGEVNREGVQRDLLPLIEGTTVNTKYGPVSTEHILFIAAGAFHLSKPSDLLPELQGRLPIRVELKPLSVEDMINILSGPETSLLKQYCALMQADGIKLRFTKDAVVKVASVAHDVNREVENIGARRLHTIMEKLLEEISFEGLAHGTKSTKLKEVLIDEKYVDSKLQGVVKKLDVVQFIL